MLIKHFVEKLKVVCFMREVAGGYEANLQPKSSKARRRSGASHRSRRDCWLQRAEYEPKTDPKGHAQIIKKTLKYIIMKKNLLLLIGVIVALGAIFTSCKKENPAYMSAKINNVDKNFIFRVTLRGGVENVFEGFMIRGTTGVDLNNGEYLTLLIRGVDKKTYDLNVSFDSVRMQAAVLYRPKGSSDTSVMYISKAGSITITDVDEKNNTVTGTFDFTLVNKKDVNDQISITDGKFGNLKYTKASLPTFDFEL